MLSSGSQWCTCKDCLNERAETFTYGCREAVTVAAAVATATTVIDQEEWCAVAAHALHIGRPLCGDKVELCRSQCDGRRAD